MIKTFPYFVLPFACLAVVVNAYGQATDCSQALIQAERAYYTGRFSEVKSILEGCLTNGFNKDQKTEAYRLVALSSIFSRNFDKADSSLLLMLKNNPPWPTLYSGSILYANQGVSFNAEIRFGTGRIQKAHRFLVPEINYTWEPDENYTYQDYVDVPFEVWDLTNNRQLMVSFRDQGRDGNFNLLPINLPAPLDESSSLEYLFIHDLEYNPDFPSSLVTTNGGQTSFLAYGLWPVGLGNWNPQALPTSTIKIDKIQEELEFVLDWEQQFSEQRKQIFYNSLTNDYWFLCTGIRHPWATDHVSAILAVDEKMQVSNAKSFIYYEYQDQPIYSLWQTNDGEAIAIKKYFYYDGVHILKFKNSLTLEFDLILDPFEFTHYYTRLYYEVFVENKGKFYLIFSRGLSGEYTGVEFSKLGINKIADFTLPNNDYIFNLIPLGESFIASCANGIVYSLDQEFNILGTIDFSFGLPPLEPNRSYGLMDRDLISWYPASGKLNFVFSPMSNNNSLSNIEYLSSKLLVGSVDSKKIIKYVAHDLGAKIKDHKSVFNEDGSAAHIVVLQTSEKTTDVMFFKTDANFNLVK